MSLSATVSVQLNQQIARPFLQLQTGSTATANAIASLLLLDQTGILQIKIVLKKTKRITSSMMLTVAAFAQSIPKIAPLRARQTGLTAAVNAIFGLLPEQANLLQTLIVLLLTVQASHSIKLTAPASVLLHVLNCKTSTRILAPAQISQCSQVTSKALVAHGAPVVRPIQTCHFLTGRTMVLPKQLQETSASRQLETHTLLSETNVWTLTNQVARISCSGKLTTFQTIC